MIDDFIIQYAKDLRKKDFVLQEESFSSNRKGKRIYLNKDLAKDMMAKLNSFFETKVEIPRVKVGKKQEIESLLNEEALLLAKYLRGERTEWIPRIPRV